MKSDDPAIVSCFKFSHRFTFLSLSFVQLDIEQEDFVHRSFSLFVRALHWKMMYKDSVNTYHKVILLGESQAGKTSIICWQQNGYSSKDQGATIGCFCHEMIISTSSGVTHMHVWDTAGQEIYRSLVPMYSKGAEAVIIVFDVTNIKSFEAVPSWFNHVDEMLESSVPIVLAANKIDMHDYIRISDSMIADFASSRNVKWFRTSAMTGEGVEDMFQYIAGLIEGGVKQADRRTVFVRPQKQESDCC